MITSFDVAPASKVSTRIVVLSSAGFMLAWLALATLRAAAMGWPDQGGMFARRIGMALVAGALAYSLHLAIVRLAKHRMPTKAVAAFCLALPVAAVFSFLNYLVFYRWFPVPSALADLERWGPQAVATTSIGEGFVDWYFVFAAWVAFRLALDHAAEARHAERGAALARAEAQDARLAMLRLQVDPHFLFNALNALSSLVTLGDTAAARRVINDLAAFFRAGLTAEPSAEIPLGQELELQRLYLNIELARFGDRLTAKFDIPPELDQVRVPALILQPLVENAVKHGVAKVSGPVEVTVSARLDGESIRLLVHDDADPKCTVTQDASTGIGLANVRSRLQATYGSRAMLQTFPHPAGWTSEIVLPANA